MYSYACTIVLAVTVLVSSQENFNGTTGTLPQNIPNNTQTTRSGLPEIQTLPPIATPAPHSPNNLPPVIGPASTKNQGMQTGNNQDIFPPEDTTTINPTEQRRLRDPEIEALIKELERRRLMEQRQRLERLRDLNRRRELGRYQDENLKQWLDEVAASSGREEEIKRYLELRDRYEPLVTLLSSRRSGSRRGEGFKNWLDEMISKFGRDWDIQGYVDHGVWWEPLVSLIFGSETMQDRDVEEGKNWWVPVSSPRKRYDEWAEQDTDATAEPWMTGDGDQQRAAEESQQQPRVSETQQGRPR